MKKNHIIKKGYTIIIIFLFFGTSTIQGIKGEAPINNIIHPSMHNITQSAYYDFNLKDNNLYNNKQNHPTDCKPGELLVKFRPDAKVNLNVNNGALTTGIASVDSLNKKYKATSADHAFKHNLDSSLASWYVFHLPSNMDVSRLADEYSHNPSILSAEPNYILHIYNLPRNTPLPPHPLSGVIPNDPYFNQQWALKDIDASDAWTIETGSPNITIAVVDTGVNYSHLDLAANSWTNATGKHGYDFVNNDSDPMDDNGHGTMCAGIAAAVTNNSLGIAGVTWRSKIMAVKSFDSSGGGNFDEIGASIVWAADHGANIISMSWGTESDSQYLLDALTYAANHGVVLVASAGDANTDTRHYPAAYDNVIAVAATDQRDALWDSSDFGGWVDVAAPGVDILTTIMEGYRTAWNSTQFACPQVAGVAALLLSKYPACPYPTLMAQTILPSAVDPINSSGSYTFGRINASKALQPVTMLNPIPGWEDIKGTVQLKGAVLGDNLRYFTVDSGFGEHPTTWVQLMNSSTSQAGVLVSWETTKISEGLYQIRLTGVFKNHTIIRTIPLYVNNRADGNYTADYYVSESFNASTPGWGMTRFASIPEAIKNARRGDTIFIYDGIYHQNISIAGFLKSVHIQGQHRNWTIIDNGSVNLIYTIGASLTGLTVRGPGLTAFGQVSAPGAILIQFSVRDVISSCRIINIDRGQSVTMWVTAGTVVKDNWMLQTYPKPFQWGCPIICNVCSSHSEISDNIILNAPVGIGCFASLSNIIVNNSISGCYIALTLFISSHNQISQNILSGNNEGLLLDEMANNNRITFNSFLYNIGSGHSAGVGLDVWLSDTYGNRIYSNNFIGNGYNAIDYGTNLYYNPTGVFHGHGNYWDDYNGTDANGDGIGDTPYQIPPSSGLDRDRFPLMHPVVIKNMTSDNLYDYYR
jgi:thermitase